MTPPNRALRCALYARISPTNEKATESGGYSNYSIASQIHEMTEFVKAQGWHTDPTLHFMDDRVTGAVSIGLHSIASASSSAAAPSTCS